MSFSPPKKLVSYWISSLLCPTVATASDGEGQERGTSRGRPSCLSAGFTPGRTILFLSTLLQTDGIMRRMVVQNDARDGPTGAWVALLLSHLDRDIQ